MNLKSFKINMPDFSSKIKVDIPKSSINEMKSAMNIDGIAKEFDSIDIKKDIDIKGTLKDIANMSKSNTLSGFDTSSITNGLSSDMNKLTSSLNNPMSSMEKLGGVDISSIADQDDFYSKIESRSNFDLPDEKEFDFDVKDMDSIFNI